MNIGTGPQKTTDWTCLNLSTGGGQPIVTMFCPSTTLFPLTTTQLCEEFRGRMPIDCTLDRIDATVTTAPTGASLLVDANECTTATSCTSLWNLTPANRLAIVAGSTSGSQTNFDDTTIAEGNYVGFDIDQVGSSTAGRNLTVTLLCQ